MKTKKSSEDIFKLIQSFSKAEAGYFIQYMHRSRIKESEGYVQLFKLIRGQKEYNENEIKERLNCPTLVRRFAYHKNILTDLVIDSLVAYKSSTSVDYRLYCLLAAIKSVKEKHLYPHALKLVDKARALAQKYEKLSALSEINNLHRIIIKNSAEHNIDKLVEEVYHEKKVLLEKVVNEDHICYLNDKAYILYNELYQVKDKERAAELEKLMQDSLLSSENNALTFNAKLRFNYLHAIYQQLHGNYNEAFKYRERILALWDQYPHMKTEYSYSYKAALNNHLNVSLSAKINPEEIHLNIEDILCRIESSSEGTKENNAALFSEIYFTRQIYMLNNGKFEQALELIAPIEKGLKKFGNSVHPKRKRSFLYNIAITYFMNEKYADALPAFERIINSNRKHEVRTDLRDISGIFNIILLYQTGKHDLALYALRNTRDRLKHGNKLYVLEQVVLHYIPLLIAKENNAAEKVSILTTFLLKLESLLALPENKNLLGLEECIVWLRKKNNLSMSR